MDVAGTRLPVVFGDPRPGDVRDSLADIERAASGFGYEPEYTVKAGLREAFEWYRGTMEEGKSSVFTLNPFTRVAPIPLRILHGNVVQSWFDHFRNLEFSGDRVPYSRYKETG